MLEFMSGRAPRPALYAAGLLAALTVVGGIDAALKNPVEIEVLGTHESGIFGEGASEIVAYDEGTQRVFSVNSAQAVVDVLDVSNESSPLLVTSLDVGAALANDPDFTGVVAGANSVAVSRGLLAVAVEANPKTDNGWAAFFTTDTLELVGWVDCGALPDMITFHGKGRFALVANEGEPNSYGEEDSVDPEGSVTFIKIHHAKRRFKATTVDFRDFIGEEDLLRADGVRIFGPGSNAAQDFEPEYISIAPNGRSAFVTLQENNAVAVLDTRALMFTRIIPLGYKDHSLPGNGLDGSDRDGAGSSGLVNIANWPVKGMYQPDGIASFRRRGTTYFVTANEGDSRDDWFPEDERIKDLILDPTAFPDAALIQNDDGIGRLTVTGTLGDTDNDGDHDELYVFGARSFSVWDEDGNLVFDSGDAFEQITAAADAANFNSTNDANGSFDTRSDNKGPEPEGVTIGKVRGRIYAFIGLERCGGVMVYDITEPADSTFVQFLNNRDFGGDAEAGTAGDLGPEGIEFVPAGPTGFPLLIVGNEVSGTTTLYGMDVDLFGQE